MERNSAQGPRNEIWRKACFTVKFMQFFEKKWYMTGILLYFWWVLKIFLIYLFIYSYLQTWETIQCTAFFSHGTQVAMFSQTCRTGISISKTGMGRDPKRKKHKAKKHKDCNPIKECGKKAGADGELQELKKKKTSPAYPWHCPLPDSKTKMPVPTI